MTRSSCHPIPPFASWPSSGSRSSALTLGVTVFPRVRAGPAAPRRRTATPPSPSTQRVDDLVGRMTLEEKVGQLLMLDARGEDLSFVNTRQPGALLHILGAKIGRAMDLAAKNRLGIPLLIGEDGIHGHSFWKGANIFPTQLAMAASWNPDLLERVGRVTAEEMAPTGIHETFSPVLCLTRDVRWGRTGETFGEDPYLIGELGAALITGYQGKGLDDPTAVARDGQALRRLLRDAGRPRRVRGRHLAPQAAQLLPAAVRARRARRRHDVHDRLPVDGRRALDRQQVAPHRRAEERVGLQGRARDRLGQRRPPRARAEGRGHLRRRRDHGGARRQRPHDDDARSSTRAPSRP